MRLKNIKLAGFKSFVDSTNVAMPGDLVGVVGPNGCGKSNIIDAVRWVMGESSAKHLRGDSMSDVIFNGSNTRKPVGQASIELVFDNSDGSAGGQYASYSEISIRRLLTKEGQSTYFLNGTRCRRRDVTDIFLGTGLGPRSYAIIEQGMISRLIEAKPDELRHLLEEAAGISKYKERRRETENRLRHTRENLSRLNDIREEVSKRIVVLDRQAKAAAQYKELKAESRELKAQALVLRWQVLQAEAEEQLVKLREDENTLEKHQSELRNTETSLEKQKIKRGEEEVELNNVQAEFYGLGADIARLEESISGAKEKKAQQQSELESAENAWAHANAHIQEDNKKVVELKASLEKEEPTLAELSISEQTTLTALAEIEQLMQVWQEEWDALTSSNAERQRVVEVERERVHHLEQRREFLNEQSKQIKTEIEGINLTRQQEHVGKLETKAGELGKNLESQVSLLDDLAKSLSSQRERQVSLEQDLDKMRSEKQVVAQEIASLLGAQKSALGGQQESVNNWLEQSGLSGAKRIANIVDVDEGWEKAVESVLGFHLQAVCVHDIGVHASLLEQLEQGEMELLSLADEPLSQGNLSYDALASKVKAPAPVLNILSQVYIVDSVSEAISVRAQLGQSESVVTREGIWFGSSWARVHKPSDENAGILQRKKLIQQLQTESERIDGSIDGQKSSIESVIQEIEAIEKNRETVLQERENIAAEHASVREELSSKKAHLEQCRSQLAQLETQLAQANIDLESVENKIDETQLHLHEVVTENEQNDQVKTSLSQRRDGYVTQLGSLRSQAKVDRDAKHQLALNVESMRTQLRLTEESLQRMSEQLTNISTRKEQLQLSLSSADDPIETLSSGLQAKLEKRLEIEKQLNEARDKVTATDNELTALDKQRHGIDQKIETIRSQVENMRIHKGELNVRSNNIIEQVTESGYEIEEVVNGLPEEADAEVWHQRLEEIDIKIRRLEPVNLAAIDEYQSEKERKTYLDAQFDDLTEAMSTLEGAISKIDKETRLRFQETFDKVNSGIKQKFPRLFGGGEAYLEMTGTDLLDTGVTVMARPPGKRNSTIHLLSGGEKALTAVAMVFAIFDLTPAPFCMLDEVDAPLDDANVGRFCELVKEMSKTVQFIFVTHNKITMELADQLLGVTMNEPGVSRLVAVDVEEAVAMTETQAAS